jgi:hypothetical protein
MIPKKKRGRPSFTPAPEDRRLVSALAGYGADQDYIASRIVNPQTGRPIDRKTLAKNFAAELSGAATEADIRVVESLFHQAVGRPAQYDDKGRLVRAEMPPVPACTIWWTKARLKWSERTDVAMSHSGAVEVTSSARERFNRRIDELAERIKGRVAGIADSAGAKTLSDEAV